MHERMSVLALLLVVASTLFSQETPRLYGEYYHAVHLGGGYFSPTTGQGGINFHFGGTIERSPRLLFGGELIYQSYKTTIFRTDNVDMTGILITTTFRYAFEAEEVTPVIGAFLEYGFHVIDESDIPWVTFEQTMGRSHGIGALAGFLVPIGERMHMLVEGRYGGDWLRTETKGLMMMSETRNVGGFTIQAELLSHF